MNPTGLGDLSVTTEDLRRPDLRFLEVALKIEGGGGHGGDVGGDRVYIRSVGENSDE